jgi:hypothetical protein
MTTRLDVLRACCLGSIAMSLMAVGALTVPRAVPLVVQWGEGRGIVPLLLAVLVLLVASGAFAIMYWFVASIAVAAMARPFTTPETVSKLLLGAGWPAFDRALSSTLRQTTMNPAWGQG